VWTGGIRTNRDLEARPGIYGLKSGTWCRPKRILHRRRQFRGSYPPPPVAYRIQVVGGTQLLRANRSGVGRVRADSVSAAALALVSRGTPDREFRAARRGSVAGTMLRGARRRIHRGRRISQPSLFALPLLRVRHHDRFLAVDARRDAADRASGRPGAADRPNLLAAIAPTPRGMDPRLELVA